MNSIALKESSVGSNNNISTNLSPMNDQDIERIEQTSYWVQFDDKDFRNSTSIDMSSNEIMNLLLKPPGWNSSWFSLFGCGMEKGPKEINI